MVVGPVSAAILCAEDAWARFRAEQNIRDPFWDVEMKNFRAKTKKIVVNGVECTQIDTSKPNVVQLDPGEKERYRDLHDKFVATYIFSTSGFDTLSRTQYKHFCDWFRPCEDQSGQCSVDCLVYYEDCGRKKNIFPGEFAAIFEFIKKELEEEED